MNKPEDMDFYYRAEVYSLGDICCSSREEYVYPKYRIYSSGSGTFKTWTETMAYIKNMVSEDAENCQIHHFRVRSVRFGATCHSAKDLWIFDAKGNQLNGPLAISPGDLVETVNLTHHDKFVTLGIVFRKDKNGYLIANTPNSLPVSVDEFDIMPLRFPVSEDLRAYFQICRDTVDLHKPWEFDPLKYHWIGSDGFARLSVSIVVDPETLVPHLHIADKNCTFVVNLRLDRPEYLDKPEPSDRLQPYQVRELVEYLNENIYGKTRWWYMLRRFWEWYDDYNLNIPLDFPLPDYTCLIHPLN